LQRIAATHLHADYLATAAAAAQKESRHATPTHARIDQVPTQRREENQKPDNTHYLPTPNQLSLCSKRIAAKNVNLQKSSIFMAFLEILVVSLWAGFV
jgi:hypothetical protein